jgi:methylmalonyl-CoA mutase cobalamin-binding domain/chain
MSDELVDAMAELAIDEALAEVKQLRDQGTAPLEILEDLQEGMRRVGKDFESGRYCISELILSAHVFKEAMELLGDSLTAEGQQYRHGKFVIGTVAGDIHDIGKNLVATVLSCHGFEVIDLGIDVEADEFVRAIEEHNPRLVGLSCLLTTAFDSMKSTVQTIERSGHREDVAILIGGAPVNEATVEFVGADSFATNANEAVTAAKQLAGASQ